MTSTTVNLPAVAPQFATVPFHEFEILAARVGDQIRVPMKPFCGTLGLPWEPQRKRIMRDAVLKEGASMMEVPSAGGVQEQLTLPADMLVGFLFTADPTRYPPELRDRMILFRRECFAALDAHFRLARREVAPPLLARPPAAPTWQELDAARRSAPPLLEQISTETRPAVRSYLYALLVADAERLGLPVPALDQLGAAGDTAEHRITRLLAGLDVLTARRKKWNHFGSSPTGRVAIVLPEIERLLQRNDIDVGAWPEIRAAFRESNALYHVRTQQIRSALTGRDVLAHIIAPSPFRASATIDDE